MQHFHTHSPPRTTSQSLIVQCTLHISFLVFIGGGHRSGICWVNCFKIRVAFVVYVWVDWHIIVYGCIIPCGWCCKCDPLVRLRLIYNDLPPHCESAVWDRTILNNRLHVRPWHSDLRKLAATVVAFATVAPWSMSILSPCNVLMWLLSDEYESWLRFQSWKLS